MLPAEEVLRLRGALFVSAEMHAVALWSLFGVKEAEKVGEAGEIMLSVFI